MMFGISKIRFSRMQFRTAGVQSMTSMPGIMPGWSQRLNSVWLMTACSVLASIERIWFCSSAGEKSMKTSVIGGVDVDDTLDRLRRVHGVKRREDQVTGFRSGDRRPDRFQVAHFADQDHVRVLTQRVLQAGGEGRNVRADFALLDGALVRHERVFDWVFHR